MKKILFYFMLGSFCIVSAISVAAKKKKAPPPKEDSHQDYNSRIKYIPLDSNKSLTKSLNGEWKFKLNGPAKDFLKPDFKDSGWDKIIVPGNWEIQGFIEPTYREPTPAEGLYRRQFTVPSNWKGKEIFIRFEGVAFGFEFWIDGKRAGSFASSFNTSDFDITKFATPGKVQTLAVRVYQHPKGWEFDCNDDWGLSGIHHDVLLFAVPKVSIEDLSIFTDISKDLSQAQINCSFDIGSFGKAPGSAQLSLTLKDPKGKQIKKVTEKVTPGKAFKTKFVVKNPMLWNAEHPNLYDLDVSLSAGGVKHSFTQKVGIRKITIDGDVIKLNYTPIKFRGVCRHDLHPDVGRAPRLKHYLEDIKLMKHGNINGIRFTHYPSQKLLVDLCDKYGIYLLDEVPIGRGEEHLKDESYLPILMKRLTATYNRDKNNPSVVIWSIGNENPVTDLLVKLADAMKKMDPSRPRLFPGSKGGVELLPESINIAAFHYPFSRRTWGKRKSLLYYATTADIKRPVLATEISHSRYYLFEEHGDRWDVIQKHPRLGGCFIWHFQDQGIWQKLSTGDNQKQFDKFSKIYGYPLKDKDTFANSRWWSGTEGIVFADRVPQPEYWTNRKIYAQIQIPTRKVKAKPGRQTIELPVENRYEFTNLDQLKGRWQLLVDGKKKAEGKVKLSVPPLKKGKWAISLELPKDMNLHENVLQLDFVDWHGHHIYDRTVELVSQNGGPDFKGRLKDMAKQALKTEEKGQTARITCGDLVVEANTGKGEVSITKGGTKLVNAERLRVGRMTVPDERQNYRKYKFSYWHDIFLEKPKVLKHNLSKSKDGGVTLSMQLEFESRRRKGETVQADLVYRISPYGWIDLDYELKPKNAKGYFMEFGLALTLPEKMGVLSWLGNGPYQSYPGQDEGDERGIFRIEPRPMTDPESRYYIGNRSGVDLATITDGKGNGIGVICNDSTVSLVKEEQDQVFSQVLRASGRGNKGGSGIITNFRIKADEIKSEKGSMRIVPLIKGNWPKLFKDLLDIPATEFKMSMKVKK